MIINDVVRRKEHVGDGNAVAFAYDFGILDEEDIEVLVEGAVKTIDTHYSVSGVGNENGGMITFVTAPANLEKIVFIGREPFEQKSVYTLEAFPPKRIENDFTKLVILAQQQREILARTLRLSKTTSAFADIATPTAVDLFLRVATMSPLTFDFATLAVLGGAIGVPVSLANGGTGANYASAHALAQGLGLARWAADSIAPAAGALTLPNPLESNAIDVSAGNFSSITTTGVANGTILLLRFAGVSVVTHGATLKLLAQQNFTTAAGDVLMVQYDGVGWIECGRFLNPSSANRLNFWRGDGSWQPSAYVGGGVRGLFLSNAGGDPTNDITVSAGDIFSDDASPYNRLPLYLPSAITKRLDATFVAGTNQGGLDTGVVGDNTYFVFLIKPDASDDPADIDLLFSLSPTAPTMPAGYTKKKRIGALMRESGVNVPFVHEPDRTFWRVTPIQSISAQAQGATEQSRFIHTPLGIRTEAIISINASDSAGPTAVEYASAFSRADVAAGLQTNVSIGNAGGGDTTQSVSTMQRVWTNTASQIRTRASAAGQTVSITVHGWNDPI